MKQVLTFGCPVNDVTIHYIREKPDYEEAERAGRRVIPLLLMHGWPGSALTAKAPSWHR